MKKLLLILISGIFISNGFSQQQFNINVYRQAKGLGKGGNIILLYQGEEKTRLKSKSSYTLTGVLPSDSIIPLVFKRPLDWPNKYFLYPNSTLTYNLEVKLGVLGTVKVTDKSEYPEGTAGLTASKTGILPKGVTVNKKNLGVSYINEKTLSSDKIREQWTRIGGKIVGRSISYVGSFAGMKTKDATSTTTTQIIGGGYVLTSNHYNLKIPEYKTGIAPWKSFVYGSALSVNMHMFGTKIDFVSNSIEDMEFSSGAFVFMLSGNLGYTFGLGKFKTQTDYKGVAIDLTYKPSIIANVGEAGGTTQLNMKGFGVDISRTSFSAFANSLAPKAKSRFSFLFLPPIKDTPLMITFGYGLVWYR